MPVRGNVARYLGADITEKNISKWRRDFVGWVESPFGFYVNRHYNMKSRRWETKRGPIRLQPHERLALEFALQMDSHDNFVFKELWWLDTGQTGKSLKNAALCQWFGMFHETDALIQVLANSKDHASERVYQALGASVRMHPYGKALFEYHDEDILFRDTLNRAIPLPKNFATQSGGSPVLRSIDEIKDWNMPRDDLLMGEIKETPARNVSQLVITSYPGFLEDVGPMNAFLNEYFTLDDTPKDDLKQPFPDLPLYVAGEAVIWWNQKATRYPWVSEKWLDRQRGKTYVSNAMFMQKWQARRTNRTDAFMPIQKWDECEDQELEPLGPNDHDVPMVGATDIGVKHDNTANVARGYDAATDRYPLLDHRIWTPAEFGGSGDIVHAAAEHILDLAKRHNIILWLYDPTQFESEAARLRKAGIPMKPFTQMGNRTEADTQYRRHILDGKLRNYPGSVDLRQHVANAVGVETGDEKIRISKTKSTGPNDGAVADSMACYAAFQLRDTFARMSRVKGPSRNIKQGPSKWVKAFWGRAGR